MLATEQLTAHGDPGLLESSQNNALVNIHGDSFILSI